MGHQTTIRPRRRGSSIVSVLPVGLAIGKYIHKFHQCDLCMTEIVLARPVLWLES